MFKKLSLIGVIATLSFSSFAITHEDQQNSCEIKAQTAQEAIVGKMGQEYWYQQDGILHILQKLKHRYKDNKVFQYAMSDEFAFDEQGIVSDLLYLQSKGIGAISSSTPINPMVKAYAEKRFVNNPIFKKSATDVDASALKQDLLASLTSFSMGKNLRTQEEVDNFFADNFEEQSIYQVDSYGIYGVQPIKKEIWLSVHNTEKLNCDTKQIESESCQKLIAQNPYDLSVGIVRDHGHNNPLNVFKTSARINDKPVTYDSLKSFFLMSDPDCAKLFKQKKGSDSVNGNPLLVVERKSSEDFKELSIDKSLLTKTPAQEVQSDKRQELNNGQATRQ